MEGRKKKKKQVCMCAIACGHKERRWKKKGNTLSEVVDLNVSGIGSSVKLDVYMIIL